ncbi:hypothetical protein BIV57_05855 [Mangrovactinospora gilvigrisea]|uniref:Solute-binding protein family 5 domain-containing protein n=2 Tax=Mangrovactinospora gilvigrisea TaxID=1428644 RepID=A0A1J7BY61_9ACTN|nr:hypothetical protein BIV57_05855 [Mangrovactinospora gilvigrisea]
MLAATGLAAAVAATAAGCGAGAAGGKASGKDARLVVGSSQDVVSLDPAGSYDLGSNTVIQGVFQTLLEFPAGTATPRPDAAKSCGWQNGGDDHTVYACTLRGGLAFSNGDPLTAEDVAFTFQRIKRIASPTGPAQLYSGIKKVQADGERVEFTLSSADATFPSKLATGSAAIVDHRVFPADKLLPDRKVIGSGRYTLASFSRTGDTRLDVNPRFKGSDKPRNGGVTLRHFASPAAAAAALRAGKIDMTDRLDADDVQKLRAQSGGSVQLDQGTGTQTRMIAFNTAHGVFASRSARQAAAHLIDRDAIAQDVYRGTVDPLYSLVPQGIAGHTTAFADAYPKVDVDAARTLLKNAGLHAPVPITYTWATGSAVGPSEAALIKKQLENGGLFSVTVRTMPWNAFLKAQAAGKLEAYNIGWSPDYPDADNFTSALLVDGGAFHTGWNDRRITGTLIPETMAETDRASAATKFAAIQQRTAESVPMIPIWQNKQYIAARSDVVGAEWTLDTTGILRYWLIAKGH